MNYCYLKNTPEFTLKAFRGKSFKLWNKETGKMLTSYEPQQGYKVEFSFELENGDVLGLSRDQLSQALVGAFENQKTLLGTSFNAKDNGKEGLEKRWFINVKFSEAFKRPVSVPAPQNGNTTTTTSQNAVAVNLPPKTPLATSIEDTAKDFGGEVVGEDPGEQVSDMPEWMK